MIITIGMTEFTKKTERVSRYAGEPLGMIELSLEERYEICMSVGEEYQLSAELKKLLETNPSPVAYDGFEPSGRMHIAQGILKSINVNKLTSSGFTFVFWVADWFAYLNHKMGGDMEKIRMVGRYFIEVWKACGMDMSRVKFLWASEEIEARSEEYWGMMLDVSTKFSLPRVTRCCTIMGRADKGLSSSLLVYPCMQTTDIFFLEADVCQLGVDQRKVNMLAREYAQKKKLKKPVILSHHMLLGLKQGQEKMSESDPASAIFMEDTMEEIRSKIKNAFCPPAQVYETRKYISNPCMDYLRYIFEHKKPIKIGDTEYSMYEEVEKLYHDEIITPSTLKECLIKELDDMILPIREHWSNVYTDKEDRPKVFLEKSLLPLKKKLAKQSKTEPLGSIFWTDTRSNIETKINGAYCPKKASYEKKTCVNPCMDYYKHIVYEALPPPIILKDGRKWGRDSV